MRTRWLPAACLLAWATGCGEAPSGPDELTSTDKVAPTLPFTVDGRRLPEWRRLLEASVDAERAAAVHALAELHNAPEQEPENLALVASGRAPGWLEQAVDDRSHDVKTAAWQACARLRVLPELDGDPLGRDRSSWSSLPTGLRRAFVEAIRLAPDERQGGYRVYLLLVAEGDAADRSRAWSNATDAAVRRTRRTSLTAASRRLSEEAMARPVQNAVATLREGTATRPIFEARALGLAAFQPEVLRTEVIEGPATLRGRMVAVRALGSLDRAATLRTMLAGQDDAPGASLALIGVARMSDGGVLQLLAPLAARAQSGDERAGRILRNRSKAIEEVLASKQGPELQEGLKQWLQAFLADG